MIQNRSHLTWMIKEKNTIMPLAKMICFFKILFLPAPKTIRNTTEKKLPAE